MPSNAESWSVLFRVDGGDGIGAGHLMRCLGLAQEFVDQGASCRLLTATVAAPGVDKWLNEGIPVYTISPSDPDEKSVAEYAKAYAADWIVIDGYHFNDVYRAGIRSEVRSRLIMYFDGPPAPAACDLMINQNPGAEKNCRQTDKTLLGVGFASLRRELRYIRTEASGVPAVLLTFGAGDYDEIIYEIMRHLSESKLAYNVEAVVATQRLAALEKDTRFKVTPFIDQIPRFGQTDVAICAGGVTSIELAAAGIPTVIVRLANNQTGVDALVDSGASLFAGTGADAAANAASLCLELIHDTERRNRMSDCGRFLVDGLGAKRIIAAMTEQEIRHD
ncbi:hypothetical protein OAJ77_00490 [Rhodospirillales bacterium]|nr:hypothetical protein [Rhodospirillales bacterium]